jgi:hypothetical protein
MQDAPYAHVPPLTEAEFAAVRDAVVGTEGTLPEDVAALLPRLLVTLFC